MCITVVIKCHSMFASVITATANWIALTYCMLLPWTLPHLNAFLVALLIFYQPLSFFHFVSALITMALRSETSEVNCLGCFHWRFYQADWDSLRCNTKPWRLTSQEVQEEKIQRDLDGGFIRLRKSTHRPSLPSSLLANVQWEQDEWTKGKDSMDYCYTQLGYIHFHSLGYLMFSEERI